MTVPMNVIERIDHLEQKMASIWSVQERTNEALLRLSRVLEQMNEILRWMTPKTASRHTEH